MSDDLIREFCENVTETLHDRTKHLSVDKILDDLGKLLSTVEDFDLYVRQKKFFTTDDDSWSDLEYLLLPYLSFSVKAGTLSRFSSLEHCVKCYLDPAAAVQHEMPSVVVKSNYSLDDDNVIHDIASVINLVYHSNVFDDMVEASAVKLTRLMLANNDSYTVDDLLRYLAKSYSEVDGLSLVTLQNHETGYKCIEIENFGGADLDEVSDELISAMVYAAKRKRVSDGYEDAKSKKPLHYACIPVLEQFGRQIAESDTFQCVLVFSTLTEVDEFLVRFAYRGTQGAVEAKSRNLQSEVLHELDTLKRDLISLVRRGDLRTELSRERLIQPRLEEILEHVLRSTAAHSVTVRNFDPFEDRLCIFAESCYPSSAYSVDYDRSIVTSNRESANVHCFLTCEPGTHVYLPDLSNQLLVTFDTERLHNPRGSLCEACFPIWKAGVPFGTLNVEGARRGSISSDIPFLSWVAAQIGDLFSTVADLVPTDAIAQLAKANELAHGSLRHGAEFSPENTAMLTQSAKSTLAAWAKFESDFRKPVEAIAKSGNELDLRSIVLDELKSAVTEKTWRSLNVNWIAPIAPQTISSLEAENLRGILQALLSNADAHSKISKDIFRFLALNRGGIRCLFIKYKSNFRMIPCNEAAYFGTLPVIKGGKVRYGAFLMGQRVRAANGILNVRRPIQNQTGLMPLELVVGLPMRSAK